MGTTIVTEKRRRGLFGWIFLILFWLWQGIMAFWLFGGISGSSSVYNSATTDAGRAGAALGTGIGITAVLIVWCLGTVILGFLVMFTRGRKILITQTVPSTK